MCHLVIYFCGYDDRSSKLKDLLKKIAQVSKATFLSFHVTRKYKSVMHLSVAFGDDDDEDEDDYGS